MIWVAISVGFPFRTFGMISFLSISNWCASSGFHSDLLFLELLRVQVPRYGFDQSRNRIRRHYPDQGSRIDRASIGLFPADRKASQQLLSLQPVQVVKRGGRVDTQTISNLVGDVSGRVRPDDLQELLVRMMVVPPQFLDSIIIARTACTAKRLISVSCSTVNRVLTGGLAGLEF